MALLILATGFGPETTGTLPPSSALSRQRYVSRGGSHAGTCDVGHSCRGCDRRRGLLAGPYALTRQAETGRARRETGRAFLVCGVLSGAPLLQSHRLRIFRNLRI